MRKKMKSGKIILIFFLSILLLSCSEKTLIINSKKLNYKLLDISDTGIFKSISGVKNDLIILTGSNEKGLLLYRPGTEKIIRLNNIENAGSRFFLDETEEFIVFQTNSINEFRRYSQIQIQNLKNENKIYPITDKIRNLKLIGVNGGSVIYTDENKLVSYELKSGRTVENPGEIAVAYSDNDLNLVLYTKGERKLLNPKGNGDYIWVSLSPDKRSILFHKVTSGTYVCGLNGEIISELGHVSHPKWSDDGKFILGTEEKDNGHQYISSDIIIINSKRWDRINLTPDTDIIALNPVFSSKKDKIYFNDERGRFFVIESTGK